MFELARIMGTTVAHDRDATTAHCSTGPGPASPGRLDALDAKRDVKENRHERA